MIRGASTFNNIFIGFDRDGTLEMQGVPISKELKNKIIELQKNGVNIFFASGKSMDFIENLANDIGIDINLTLMCAENGGHIKDFQNNTEIVFGNDSDLKQFVTLIENEKLPPNRHEYKVSIWSRKFDDRVIEAGEIISEIIKKNGLNLEVFTYPQGDGGLDVVPPDIDKVNLLQFIQHDAIIHYFGDSYNDLNLMKNPRVIPHTTSNAEKVIKDHVGKKSGRVSQYPASLGVFDILRKIL